MASLGGSGLRELAQLNHDKAEYLKTQLAAAGIALPFTATTFNEFVAAFPKRFTDTYRRLLGQKVVAGLPLEVYYPELPGHYLLCVTETLSKADIDTLVREVQS
jgi:glycine dehydrogenase subunit 1